MTYLTTLPRLVYVLITLMGYFVEASAQGTLQLPDGGEVSPEVYGSGNPSRILWIAPSHGIHERQRQMGKRLAETGFEVWQVDLSDALFLTRGASSMRQVPANVVARLIQQLSRPGEKLLVISSSYGAIPTLRGVQHWQSQGPARQSLSGVILFSPYLYTQVPPVGQAPEFIPVNTSVPIYIFQAEKNGNRWHFPALLQHLQQHATVYHEIMPGATSLFYDKDTASATFAMLDQLPVKLTQRAALLAKHEYALGAPAVEIGKPAGLGLDAQLTAYQGTTRPRPFTLNDVNGRPFSRRDFKGKVTVINFWASWCPPCVEEIPSLNRLRARMQGRNFELISINYAESAEQIKRFMQQVKVDFPVLIDPQGRLAGQWRVVAFPSTFVIGPDGEIHYGVNAAIHWDTDEILEKLEQLSP